MYNSQAVRLLRETWKSPNDLAQELFTILTSTTSVVHDGPLQINGADKAGPLTTNSTDSAGLVATFKNGSDGSSVGVTLQNGVLNLGNFTGNQTGGSSVFSSQASLAGLITGGPCVIQSNDGNGNYHATLYTAGISQPATVQSQALRQKDNSPYLNVGETHFFMQNGPDFLIYTPPLRQGTAFGVKITAVAPLGVSYTVDAYENGIVLNDGSPGTPSRTGLTAFSPFGPLGTPLSIGEIHLATQNGNTLLVWGLHGNPGGV